MPITRTRTVTDQQGRRWRIYERAAPRSGNGWPQTYLVGETRDLLRRFNAFPDDWFQMGDDALVGLVTGPPSRGTSDRVMGAAAESQSDARVVAEAHTRR